MTLRDRITTALILAAASYLGFYVFGLVMSVYSPGDVLYFTIPAIAMVALLTVKVIQRRRAAAAGGPDDPATRESRHLRETRGF